MTEIKYQGKHVKILEITRLGENMINLHLIFDDDKCTDIGYLKEEI